MKTDGNIRYDILASMTEGFSGAEIKNVCTEAGYIAIRNGRKYVNMTDLITAIEKIKAKNNKAKNTDRTEKYV